MRIGRLKIGGRTFRVESWPFKDADDAGAQGDCNHRIGRIRVSDGYAVSAQAETLVHEVLHALIRDTAVQWSNEDEEKWVERFSPRLTAFLADNPEQVRELLRMLK